MTQNEKDLLLKDLCARLPYGVKIERYDTYYGAVSEIDETHNKIDYFRDFVGAIDITFLDKWIEEYNVKPYLFPLSSMTEWQEKELEELDPEFYTIINDNGTIECVMNNKTFDWFHKHHFDWRGLIPMGLANDATGLNIY